MPPEDLKHKVEALQLSIEGLLRLVSSHDEEKRWEFWEIIKGITTRAEFAMFERELASLTTLVGHAEKGTQVLISSATLIRQDQVTGR